MPGTTTRPPGSSAELVRRRAIPDRAGRRPGDRPDGRRAAGRLLGRARRVCRGCPPGGPGSPRPIPVSGFREVFEAVRDGQAEVGVVPIENVVNGTVREIYDLLLEHDLVIRGEVVVPVRLCLAALPGARLEEIDRVYSHIQALGQADALPAPAAVVPAHDLQHGRSRTVDRGAGGARFGGGPVAPGRGPFRAGGPGRQDRERSRQPDQVRPRRPTGPAVPGDLAPNAGRPVESAHDPRLRGPQRAGRAAGASSRSSPPMDST